MAFEYENERLRVFFLPYFLAGHMIPLVEIARLLAAHGVNVTIVATTANAAIFQNAIDRDSKAGHSIRTHLVQFPSTQVGLPYGVESLNAAVSADVSGAISRGITLLRDQVEQLFKEARPDCIVSDMFHPWTADVAVELGIPRLVFNGSGYFQLCAVNSLVLEDDVVLLKGLPHKIELLRTQIPDFGRNVDFASVIEEVREANKKTYGVLMNSFSELEGEYEEHYRNKLGGKAWSLGPISLWVNKDFSEKAERGNNNVDERCYNNCDFLLNWLNSKEQNSVLYVCFGSLTRFPTIQLVEIAHGLEASEHPFIWVVLNKKENSDDDEDIDKENEGFLERFEERMKESQKGLVIREWAPQMLILEHPALGGTVTHCGWNSIVEAVTAGLPMITWPLFSEQFYNEKLLTEVVRIGVSVGVKKWSFDWWHTEKEVVKRDKVEKVVRFLMSHEEEALEMRKRVKKLSEAAKVAVQSGGSSQSNLTALINELKSLKIQSTRA